MIKSIRRNEIVWTTVFGTVICVVFSVVFFGVSFAATNRPPMYLVVLGFAGSLSLALLRNGRIRDTIYLNILIYFFFAILSTLLLPKTALIFLLYYFAMLIALYIYVSNFDAKVSQIRFGRPLVLAAMMGLFYVITTILHALIFLGHFSTVFLLANLPIGFLLGLGYGFGDEISEYLAKA